METKQATCEERVDKELRDTLKTLRRLWKGYCNGDDEVREEFYNYGLGFDYVSPGTFKDQDEGYWRYQLSWGGPSDEFRFFASSPDDGCYRIEYWFMDWFDGACRVLRGGDRELLDNIWSFFQDIESTRHAYNKARED